jgi:transglutaminase-like putative cysteine protease
LRVGVLENYANDQWRPGDAEVRYTRRPDIQLPRELQDSVPRETYRLSVDESRIEAPQIAAPTPLVSGDLDGVAWGLDRETSVASVNRRASSYSFNYLALNPTPEALDQPVQGATGALLPPELQVDPASEELVRDLVGAVVPDGASRIEAARAIQTYLRTGGGFSYSLELPETVTNEFGQSERPDAVSLFLRTKVGYCVQFATAMVMMARESGIPARMAIGFLPGTADRGTYTVRASDAHAWPELFFEGIGWLRFEPTPSGSQNTVAPPYSLAPTTPNSNDPSSTGSTNNATSSNTRPDGGNDPGAQDPTTTSGTEGDTTSFLGPQARTALLWLVLGLVAGILGSLAVPLAARTRLRRRLKDAPDEATRVEIEWQAMVERLGDLGVIPPRGSTPRQAGRFYQREAYLEGEESQALKRVVDGVERSRYAPPGTTLTDVRPDTHHVVRAVSGVRRRKDRIRALWWPSDGLLEWRERRGQMTRLVRSPWDRWQERRADRD